MTDTRNGTGLKRHLYTVYRTKDDAILVFEEPIDRAAEALEEMEKRCC